MITIHILLHGKTFCGFGADTVPGEWPEGHRWVSVGTKVLAPGVAARFCEECAEMARKAGDSSITR